MISLAVARAIARRTVPAHLVEDAASVGWAAAWKAKDQNYSQRAAEFAILDFYRKESRSRHSLPFPFKTIPFDPDIIALQDKRGNRGFNPSESEMIGELDAWTALESVTPNKRKLVIRHFWYGESKEQIGKWAGCSRSNVSLHIKSALATMRERLAA